VCEESPSSEEQLPLQLEAVEELTAPPPSPLLDLPALDSPPAATASLSEEAPLCRRPVRRRG